MVWFAKSSDYKPDTPYNVYLDNTGDSFFDLECDQELLVASVETIRNQLRDWAIQELALAEMANEKIDKIKDSLIFKLNNLDTKFLPYDEGIIALENILNDPELYYSVSRLMDTIVRITMYVPANVLECLTGRFIYAMCYNLSYKLAEVAIPPKKLWLELLSKHPWIPLIPIIQEIYRTDNEYSKLSDKLNTPPNHQVNIVTPTPTAMFTNMN